MPFAHREVVRAVQERADSHDVPSVKIAEDSGLTPDQVRRIRAGKIRQPRAASRPALSTALGWPEDMLDRIGRGEITVEEALRLEFVRPRALPGDDQERLERIETRQNEMDAKLDAIMQRLDDLLS